MATLVVARLAQAASMGCGGRLDRGHLLPCGHHEKAVNTFLSQIGLQRLSSKRNQLSKQK